MRGLALSSSPLGTPCWLFFRLPQLLSSSPSPSLDFLSPPFFPPLSVSSFSLLSSPLSLSIPLPPLSLSPQSPSSDLRSAWFSPGVSCACRLTDPVSFTLPIPLFSLDIATVQSAHRIFSIYSCSSLSSCLSLDRYSYRLFDRYRRSPAFP